MATQTYLKLLRLRLCKSVIQNGEICWDFEYELSCEILITSSPTSYQRVGAELEKDNEQRLSQEKRKSQEFGIK